MAYRLWNHERSGGYLTIWRVSAFIYLLMCYLVFLIVLTLLLCPIVTVVPLHCGTPILDLSHCLKVLRVSQTPWRSSLD